MTGTVALNMVYDGLLSMVLSKKNIPNSRLKYKNHTLFITKLAKITAKNPYYLGRHIPT